MESIRKIYEQVQAIGQCGKFTGNETIEELVALFRTAQGQEFCLNNSFPSRKIWLELNRVYDLSRFGIYVDAGHIELHNEPHITLIGDTSGERLHYDELKRHDVVLMHGARANIVTEKWALVFVHNDSSSTCTKEQKDNSKIL